MTKCASTTSCNSAIKVWLEGLLLLSSLQNTYLLCLIVICIIPCLLKATVTRVLISTGASKVGEYSKSDSSIPDALHSNRKSADNGPENKNETDVVPTEDSNGTDLHDNHSQMEEDHSPSVSSAGMCAPIYDDDGINYVNCGLKNSLVSSS